MKAPQVHAISSSRIKHKLFFHKRIDHKLFIIDLSKLPLKAEMEAPQVRAIKRGVTRQRGPCCERLLTHQGVSLIQQMHLSGRYHEVLISGRFHLTLLARVPSRQVNTTL